MRKNFKSYGAWHHRKWVLSKGHSSTDNELRLLNGFQKADPRNFHAWNYRRLNIGCSFLISYFFIIKGKKFMQYFGELRSLFMWILLSGLLRH